MATTRIPQASGTLRAKGARCATRKSPSAMGGCARHAVMHMKAFAARAQMVLQLPQIIRRASHARPDTRAIPKACSLALRADTQPWEQPDAPSVLLGALATRQVSSTLAAPGAAAWHAHSHDALQHRHGPGEALRDRDQVRAAVLVPHPSQHGAARHALARAPAAAAARCARRHDAAARRRRHRRGHELHLRRDRRAGRAGTAA